MEQTASPLRAFFRGWRLWLLIAIVAYTLIGFFLLPWIVERQIVDFGKTRLERLLAGGLPPHPPHHGPRSRLGRSATPSLVPKSERGRCAGLDGDLYLYRFAERAGCPRRHLRHPGP